MGHISTDKLRIEMAMKLIVYAAQNGTKGNRAPNGGFPGESYLIIVLSPKLNKFSSFHESTGLDN